MARPEDMYDDEMYDEEALPPPSASWMDALQDQFGSVPWWVVSATVHVVILLLMTLIVVSKPPADTTDVVIPMDLAQEPPPEPEIKQRDIFESEQEIPLEEIVENPVFIHEEVEVEDHMETSNNMDSNTAKGQEDAISDIPLGGTGVVGHLGVGGGAAGAFGFRSGGGRRRAALRGGGSRKSESSVESGLRWLARHQTAQGNWEVQRWGGERDEEAASVGVTGLGLLAFLGAGHTEKTGEHKRVVQKAVSYLVSQQGGSGALGGKRGYNHGIAGLALAEAYGMAGMERTRGAAQKGVDYSINDHQNPMGGWRYSPRSVADTSVTGWFVMQLKSAIVAGLKVDPKGFQGAIAFMDKVTEMPGGGVQYPGRAKYQPDKNYTATMTSVGMLCRQFMGWKRQDPLLVGAANYLMQHLPEWDRGGTPFYYWYYGTLVMFQMGGDWWKTWNASIRDMLISHQHNTPHDLELDGSWDPLGWDGTAAGRAYSTAMGCLTLEVYYRYLPIYK